MDNLFKQCVIENVINPTCSQVCWLDAKVKKGWKITLKDSGDPKEWWLIKSVGTHLRPRNDIWDQHKSKKWFENDFHGRLTGLNIQ